MRDVIDVALGEGHRLILTFEGGERREVDVRLLVPFDGVFEPLKDDAYFRQVRVDPDVGTIVWPNGPDICPDVLYESGRKVAGSAA
ncbi:MAG: DUF2442 domain-containing protein [Planctomycetota bacterium]